MDWRLHLPAYLRSRGVSSPPALVFVQSRQAWQLCDDRKERGSKYFLYACADPCWPGFWWVCVCVCVCVEWLQCPPEEKIERGRRKKTESENDSHQVAMVSTSSRLAHGQCEAWPETLQSPAAADREDDVRKNDSPVGWVSG